MIQLTRKHNEAFQAKADADFVREVIQYLRENHADTVVKLPSGDFIVADLPDETIKKMVNGGIEKARGYRMTWESTLAAFVTLMFVTAPNFDTNAEVEKVLRNDAIFSEERIKSLWSMTNEQTWNTVIEAYKMSDWMVA